MLACGIDVGTAQTKCLIVDGNRIVQGRGVVHSGSNLGRAARHALKEALREAGCEEFDLTLIMGTGYGRFAIPFGHKSATETTCHARGAIYRYPQTRTVLDMGGQDTTAIKISPDGDVLDFAMNDKCAAGGGRSLESLADLLGMTVPELGEVEIPIEEILPVTNVCSVFAEQEIINYLERGSETSDVVGGAFTALARRGASLLMRVGLEDEITITGGVSRFRGVVRSLERILERSVNSGIDGVYVGALGAALIGLDQVSERT